MSFIRITKRAAQKRFAENLAVYLCPRKLAPCSPWNIATLILRERDGESYQSWDQMYNNWAYYNTSYETGYYAHYYMEASQLVGSK